MHQLRKRRKEVGNDTYRHAQYSGRDKGLSTPNNGSTHDDPSSINAPVLVCRSCHLYALRAVVVSTNSLVRLAHASVA